MKKPFRDSSIWGAYAAVAVVAGAVTGCDARHRTEHDVWTLFDIRAAFDAGGNVAIGATLPAGMPASMLLDEWPDGSVHLKVQRAFAEGRPAAFVTTELWVNYTDALWLQPIYAQFRDATLATPVDAPHVIDVGPDSSFYSPFWQLNAAVVGDVDGYHSSKQVLEAASEIRPLGTRTCPLRPLDIPGSIALPEPWDAWNISLDTIPAAEAVYDDKGQVRRVGLFDFGPNLFSLEVDARNGAVIEELPIFLFVDSTGQLLAGEPRVAGVGPFLSGRAADVGWDAAGRPQPRFGAFWRVYAALLPMEAGPFQADALHADAVAAAQAAGVDPLELDGRVALDMKCFDEPSFPAGCVWLDSQAKVEAILGPASLIATEITGTCPFVFYDKQAVKR